MPDSQPESPFRVCIPLEERSRNNVDRYLRNIEEIQGYCEHDFRFLEPPDPRESKVKGVFIILEADWNRVIRPRGEWLQCLLCSFQKIWNPFCVCSRCLWEGKFEKLDLYRREVYFSESYSCFRRARLYRCPKCELQMVADEWN